MTVPASATALTSTWLQQAMSLDEDAAPQSLSVERIGEAYGFASEIYRCGFSTGGRRRSVIVKLWPTNSPASAHEVRFYETFGRDPGLRVPACFRAAVDIEEERGVLVLEDLASAEQGDCLQTLTEERGDAVARSLAGLHATWHGHPTLREATWLRSMESWEPDAGWFEPRRSAFLERFGDRLDDLGRAVLDRVEEIPRIAGDRLREAPVTLLHADLHLDNVLFEERGPVILDWARCAKGPLALDLAALLFDLCAPDNVEPALAAYLREWRRLSGRALDAEVLHRGLGGALLRRFAAVTCGIVRWEPPSKRQRAIVDAHVQRAQDALHAWRERDANLFSFVS